MNRTTIALAVVGLLACSANARITSRDDGNRNFVVCSNGRGGGRPLDEVAMSACPGLPGPEILDCGEEIIGPRPDAGGAPRALKGPCCEYHCHHPGDPIPPNELPMD